MRLSFEFSRMSRFQPPILSLIAALLLGGCAATPPTRNPSFPITAQQASQRLKALEGKRIKLERPLVILGGFLDLGVGPYLYEKQIQRFFDGRVIRVSFADCVTFEACRAKLIATLTDELGGADADRTAEVDVIGQSMGGLVAIFASLEDPALGKRLNIHRLFTISSPLSGAKLATLTPFNVFGFQADMRPDSPLYQRLAKTRFHFPIYSYTRLDDTSVGEAYASLPGRGVWWLDNVPGERAHIAIFRDDRVLLDIVLRLRGDKPVTTYPPAPLPTTQPVQAQ